MIHIWLKDLRLIITLVIHHFVVDSVKSIFVAL